MKTLKVFMFIGVCVFLAAQKPISFWQKPSNFPKPIFDFKERPLDSAKVFLGRLLFFDPILSKDYSISCASCHSPYNAFAHTDHPVSHGINDQIGNRNAPALFNLAWQKLFMWDGAVNHIEVQSLAPISHPKEMNENINAVLEKLKKSSLYKSALKKAFGDSIITSVKLLKAIAQFELTLVSANAKYDKVYQGKDTFTAQEKRGYELFKKHCNTCHQEPLFSSYEFANNGLKPDEVLNDYGRFLFTRNPIDSFKFKIPSLRNLAYTYPYMHDGRFKKLSEVLNHYINDTKTSLKIAEQLKDGIPLKGNDKADLLAFLNTLNDMTFVFNPTHQFPKELLQAKEGN